MLFGAPYILWALGAVSIPVIVHLFDFRRYRKVQFSDNYLLLQLMEKNRRQNRIRRLIIMCLRMLFIAALILAFAKPYFPRADSGAATGYRQYVSIYIDNSLSMSLSEGKSDLLEQGRAKAREIMKAYPAGTLYRLITNEFSGEHDRFVPYDECQDMVNQIGFSSFARPMSQVISRMVDLADNEAKGASHHFYLISDFQKVTSDVQNVQAAGKKIFLMPLTSSSPANISVDSVWFSGPVQLENNILTVSARIRNYSDIPMEKISVRLNVDGRQKGLSDVQLAAMGSDVVDFSFTVNTRGSHEGYIEIDDSPVSFDDRMFFAFDIASSVPVYHIRGSSATGYIDDLFSQDSLFDFSSVSEGNVNMEQMTRSGLVILDEPASFSSGMASELSQVLDAGGNILIIPAESFTPEKYRPGFSSLGIPVFTGTDTANTRVAGIDATHPLFRGVFVTPPTQVQFPAVFTSYRMPSGVGRSVIRMLNNQSFLTEFAKSKGKIYVLSVPLQSSYSSFASNALIVPVVMQMAFSSRIMPAVAYPLDYTYGIDLPGGMISGEKPPIIRSFDGASECIPGFTSGNPPRIFLNAQITQPGAYTVFMGDKKLMSFGMNYSRTESQPGCYEAAELQNLVKDKSGISVHQTGEPASAIVAEMQSGTKLWKIFIIFALIIYATELILLRIWT